MIHRKGSTLAALMAMSAAYRLPALAFRFSRSGFTAPAPS